MEKLNFILTSDDVGRDKVEIFNQFVSFLDENDVKCTFFAVPKPRDNPPLAENPEWIDALKRAINNGHDVQLHGFTHEKFECGFPPGLVLGMHGREAREELIKKINEEKNAMEENLTLEKLSERFSESKKMFEGIFGYSPICFRSTLLGMCENFYPSLSKAGIKYCSNLVVNPRGWNHIIGELNGEIEWDKNILPSMKKVESGITELPISCEYTWFLKEEDIDKAVEIMKEDARRISKIQGAFMMPLSHFYAVVKSPAGMEAYRKFFEYAKKNFEFKSYTIKSFLEESNLI